MERYDVAVVGLGALGSGAAYQAAVKGAKVIGFEQFELGHVRGASHDTSRIVRTSYGSPEFVALARSAYKDWADLEKRSGLNLLDITGGVVFLPRNGPTPSSDFTKSLDANGVPYELLDSKEVNRRWPGFNIPDGIDAVYTADTGIVHASKAVTTMQYQARANGAVLREKTRVDRLIPDGNGVIIETSKGRVRAGKVILAADAWINKLLGPLGAEIPLTVMQEQITYFKPENPALFEPERFPVWIWGGEKWFYGFPTYGEPTIKAGQDAQENFMTPDNRTFVPSQKVFKTLKDHMDTIIPGHGQDLRTVTCQYSITPDRQFIIGPIQKNPNIIVALGNGHAFKFAPAIGRVVAELAIDGKTSDDISKFPVPTPAGSSKL
ncbi:FAD dependent oxidoreductase [Aspergillus caelatus]|uniref:FAD dependent oxidoreductase n=2 Tax=Aspergillus subgen. Circumdati TaxID=2720871 RepID=A0A5N6ZYL2_9EURO|nr:FAD dependent oxidoreductase [Aspergillus caelatus]KAE8362448.1 FAD dependent oxidoreductase [Aspergillus caelatus]KAE8414673.1 FAD dependent oxidoreductase [Aspergillus pseudocaelatus]